MIWLDAKIPYCNEFVRLTHVTKLPASRNNTGMGRSNTRDGTDISLGFQAAKAAMKDSKSDKSGEFFVFLSDGTPSTFTVYFDTRNSSPTAPGTIVAMTANIKANGCSATNARSAYWAINLPGSQPSPWTCASFPTWAPS